ncbi:MAG: hypothetical protein QOF76_1992, partial [Solirubrobacteraceae bacterium]|nr:hypothetical protein [Solirubrobacteraceae bacterium]
TVAQKVKAAAAATAKAQPDASTGVRRSTVFDPNSVASDADRAVAATVNNTTAAVNSLGTAEAAAQAGGSALDHQIANAISDNDFQTTIKNIQAASNPPVVNGKKYDPPGLPPAKAAFATDQIYTAAGTLKVNGVDVNPVGKIPTLIVPSDVSHAIPDTPGLNNMTILTQHADLSLPSPADAPAQVANIGLDTAEHAANDQFKATVGDAENAAKRTLLDQVNLLKDKIDLGPFKLAGLDATVKLNDDGTVTLHAQAALPDFLTTGVPGSHTAPTSVGVDLHADTAGHIKLQGLQLNVGEAFLFGIHIKNLFLSYDGHLLSARGQITFDFLAGSGIDIKSFAVTNDGQLQALVIDYLAGRGQGFAVGPGIFLTKIGGGHKAGDTIELDGDAALSMAPSLGDGCPTVGIDTTQKGDAGFRLQVSPHVVMDAHANAQIFCQGLANVNFHAAPNDGHASLTADLGLSVPDIAHINGTIKGEIQTSPNLWQMDADGKAGFDHIPLAVDLKGVVGSLGIAACGHVTIPTPWPFDDINLAAGAGVKFPGGVPPITAIQVIANFRAFTGCDLGAFSPLHAVRSARAAGAPLTFPLGKAPVALSLEGAGAAPRVILISPSGKRYDYSADDAIPGKFVDDSFGAVIPTEDRSVIMLHHPERGIWTAQTADGSTPVVRVQSAPVLPDPRVKASVSGKGTTRTVRYDITPIDGQIVNFVEQAQGGYKILEAVKRGGKGRFRYTVGEADSTHRTLTAQVNQDGMPRQRIEVAHFTAPNPKVGTPKLRIRRRGSKAIVSWDTTALAAHYVTTVKYADGRTRAFSGNGKQRSVTVPAVGPTGGLRVWVTAYSATERHGKTGTARLRPPHRPKPHKRHQHRKKHR